MSKTMQFRVFCFLNLRICFEFRYSDFGFSSISMFHVEHCRRMSVLPAFGILLASAGLIWLGIVML